MNEKHPVNQLIAVREMPFLIKAIIAPRSILKRCARSADVGRSRFPLSLSITDPTPGVAAMMSIPRVAHSILVISLLGAADALAQGVIVQNPSPTTPQAAS